MRVAFRGAIEKVSLVKRSIPITKSPPEFIPSRCSSGKLSTSIKRSKLISKFFLQIVNNLKIFYTCINEDSVNELLYAPIAEASLSDVKYLNLYLNAQN